MNDNEYIEELVEDAIYIIEEKGYEVEDFVIENDGVKITYTVPWCNITMVLNLTLEQLELMCKDEES